MRFIASTLKSQLIKQFGGNFMALIYVLLKKADILMGLTGQIVIEDLFLILYCRVLNVKIIITNTGACFSLFRKFPNGSNQCSAMKRVVEFAVN